MNRSIFIRTLVCVIFMLVLSTSFCVSKTYALGDIFSQGKGFLEKGNDVSETIDTTELKKTSDYIYNTLLAIGIMVAIIVAMILGIQFMVASADEKAKVKEALIPFLVGCIVVFGAFTIWKVVVNMGSDAEDSVEVSYYCADCGISLDLRNSSAYFLEVQTLCENCYNNRGGGGSTIHQSSSGTIHGGGGGSF